MLSFRSFLTEKNEFGNFEKLTHLHHIEDSMINHGERGFHHAVGALEAVHDKFQHKFNPTKITQKYDGSSTVVFGHHPQTGKFFVGTKSVFSKNPKVSYTPEDIEKHHKEFPLVIPSMKNALEHLPKVTPKNGVYQGDIMHSGLEHNVHDLGGMYNFTPNTIMYSIPKKSEEGEKLRKSKIGVAIHTKYHGSSLDKMKAGFDPDIQNFKKHSHVHMLPLGVDTSFQSGKNEMKYNFHAKQIERAHRAAPPDTFKVIEPHKDRMNRYINLAVRNGSKPDVEGYMNHLLSTDVDTVKKKTNAIERAKYVLDHKDQFHSLFSIHNHIQKAKDVLIDNLNHNVEYEHSIGGKQSSPEGYVVHHEGYPLKFVNRNEFSRNNFQHNIKEENYFIDNLTEGGNIKVGNQAASPIHVTSDNRESIQHQIHHTLGSIHDSFYSEHKHHLFGKDKKAIHTGSAFSGSTHSLMSQNISHKEFAKHKANVGDIDVQIPKEHSERLKNHLKVGRMFGNYEVVGIRGHGSELSALMKHHPSGKIHQFDFEHSEYHNNEPTIGDQFAHKSAWGDIKSGIKGVHHKILIHTIGGDKYKYSMTHGLRLKSDIGSGVGIKDPKAISHVLFGSKADHTKMHSFHDVVDLIKHHVPKHLHQGIYDRFKTAVEGVKNLNNSHALGHLKKHLHVEIPK